MPSFPNPPSPQRSSRSFEFKGKFFFAAIHSFMFVEFNLATNMRERKSAPPLKQDSFDGIKAREMPNFNKIEFKPAKNNRDLTVPQGFELASLRRHEVAR